MKKRPTSISVISWVLIVTGGLSLIQSTLNINHPMTKNLMGSSTLLSSFMNFMMFAGPLMTIICGVAILKRQNWSRYLYVIWCIINGIMNAPMKFALLPVIIIFGAIVYFLFRPAANEYFLPSFEPSNDLQGA